MKTVVKWQFNRKFRIQRTLPTKKAALEYIDRVKRLWHIKARIAK
jgi:hypothetical protein